MQQVRNDDSIVTCKNDGNTADNAAITKESSKTFLIYFHTGKDSIRCRTIHIRINKANVDKHNDTTNTILGLQSKKFKKQ